VKIGVIGAGNIGGNLTRLLTARGHDVAVANSREPESLAALALETGAAAVSVTEVAKGVDLVILAIPERAIPNLPSGILDDATSGVPIVDCGNYLPKQRDGRIDAIEFGVTESRWVSQQLGRSVVKALNCISAVHLVGRSQSAGTPGRIALPVAGDEPKSKATVMRLIDELGFDAVDSGTIDESWRQQPGTPVFCADLNAAGVTKALREAHPDRPQAFRA